MNTFHPIYGRGLYVSSDLTQAGQAINNKGEGLEIFSLKPLQAGEEFTVEVTCPGNRVRGYHTHIYMNIYTLLLIHNTYKCATFILYIIDSNLNIY